MPPRRRTPAAAESLTAENLATLAAAVAEGRRATVYLREGTPSLGLPAGSSARVISVAEGTVVVRPRGIDDELPYEADELRMTKNAPPPPEKPARKRAPATAKKVSPRTTDPSTELREQKTGLREQATSEAREQKTEPRKQKPEAREQKPETREQKPEAREQKPEAGEQKAAKKPASARKAAAAKSVTVTLYGSADNQWSVALTRGAHKPQRSRPVSPEIAEAAAAAIGDEPITHAVTGLLQAARLQAQARVAELQRELDAAKAALAQLDTQP